MKLQEPPNQDIRQHIRQHLDAQPIGADIRRRLRLARHQALDRLDAPRAAPLTTAARAGLAFAGIAALALLLMLGLNRFDRPPASDSLDAFEIATSGEPLEFYEQELEFYLWLEEQDLG